MAQSSMTEAPTRKAMLASITEIIAMMDNGQGALFAKRIGVAKSTLHHWIKGGSKPILEMALRIAGHTGVSLVQLLTGDLKDWKPPPARQRILNLELVRVSRVTPRVRDWANIESRLKEFLGRPTPIPLWEAARQLEIDPRQLYLRVNTTARQVGERWRAHAAKRPEQAIEKARPYLEEACFQIWSEGKAVTLRDMRGRVPAEVLFSVSNLLGVLKDVQAKLAMRDVTPDQQ